MADARRCLLSCCVTGYSAAAELNTATGSQILKPAHKMLGKLFPGPHLYAGAAITVLWALAAALVPAMQRGNEGARQAHIGLNVLNILLFAWQVRQDGMEGLAGTCLLLMEPAACGVPQEPLHAASVLLLVK